MVGVRWSDLSLHCVVRILYPFLKLKQVSFNKNFLPPSSQLRNRPVLGTLMSLQVSVVVSLTSNKWLTLYVEAH